MSGRKSFPEGISEGKPRAQRLYQARSGKQSCLQKGLAWQNCVQLQFINFIMAQRWKEQEQSRKRGHRGEKDETEAGLFQYQGSPLPGRLLNFIALMNIIGKFHCGLARLLYLLMTELNGSSYYRANPFYQQGYMPDGAYKNRKDPAYMVELPQGNHHFEPSTRKHFQRVGYSTTIGQEHLMDPDNINSPSRDRQYLRNLNVEDIDGANTNTLISKAVKNRMKAKQYLVERERAKKEGEDKEKMRKYEQKQYDARRLEALSKIDRSREPNYHEKVMKLKTEESQLGQDKQYNHQKQMNQQMSQKMSQQTNQQMNQMNQMNQQANQMNQQTNMQMNQQMSQPPLPVRKEQINNRSNQYEKQAYGQNGVESTRQFRQQKPSLNRQQQIGANYHQMQHQNYLTELERTEREIRDLENQLRDSREAVRPPPPPQQPSYECLSQSRQPRQPQLYPQQGKYEELEKNIVPETYHQQQEQYQSKGREGDREGSYGREFEQRDSIPRSNVSREQQQMGQYQNQPEPQYKLRSLTDNRPQGAPYQNMDPHGMESQGERTIESPINNQRSQVREMRDQHRRINPTYLSYGSAAIGMAGRNIVGS